MGLWEGVSSVLGGVCPHGQGGLQRANQITGSQWIWSQRHEVQSIDFCVCAC